MGEFDPPPAAPPGWYPDPRHPGQTRHWDGIRWTAPVEGAGTQEPPYSRPPKAPAKSIWALSLAIGSWLICPIIAAVAALILARSASKELASSGNTKNGRALNKAARIVAWANIGVWVYFAVSILVWAWLQTPSITATGSLAPEVFNGAGVDSTLNERTSLQDGSYFLRPQGRILAESRLGGDVFYCAYQGDVYTEQKYDGEHFRVKEATIFGNDYQACLGVGRDVVAVYFTVTSGVAHDLRVLTSGDPR